MSKDELLNLCKRAGTLVACPSDIVGWKLLFALSGNESSFGANNVPRHEQGYCYKGRYYDAKLSQQYGCLAHCSFGPWQVMLPNCPGADPIKMHTDEEYALHATIAFINSRIFKSQGAKTLAEFADSYNSGNFKDANIPQAYIDKFIATYNSLT